MKNSVRIVLLSLLLMAGCAGDPYQGLYEGIKSQNEANRSPTERAITPAPDYDTYKKERERLNTSDPDLYK